MSTVVLIIVSFREYRMFVGDRGKMKLYIKEKIFIVIYYFKRYNHCVQSSTATVVWFHFRLARKDVRTREVVTFFENCVI
jgi:hypothetical protein